MLKNVVVFIMLVCVGWVFFSFFFLFVCVVLFLCVCCPLSLDRLLSPDVEHVGCWASPLSLASFP